MANNSLGAKTGNPVVTYTDASAPAAGEIQAFAGSSAPSGWLLCDGSEVSQTVYASLFAVIGSTYNTQINPTTGSAWAAPSAGNFRVPDLRGVFLRGVGTPTGADPVTLGGYQADQNLSHAHTIHTWTSGGGTTYNGVANIKGSSFTVIDVPNDASTGMTTSGGNEARPRSKGVNYIIRCFTPQFVAYGAGQATSTKPGIVQGGTVPGASGSAAIASGYTGQELVFSQSGSNQPTSSGVAYNIMSATIPEGVWDVTGFAFFGPGTSSGNTYAVWNISASSASIGLTYNQVGTASGALSAGGPTFPMRLTVAPGDSQTVYLIGQANYSSLGTLQFNTGRIRAVRV